MVGVLVDGVATTQVSALDRGLAYGDGVFETLLVIEGVAPFWQQHVERLGRGCHKLRLPMPDWTVIEQEMRTLCSAMSRAIVRITLTRGVAERGYAPPAVALPTRIVAAFPAPDPPVDWYEQGVRVRWCETRLGLNPVLAGIKHLNRLEQVLARAEWDDPDISEGLMCDSRGLVISATAANVFCVSKGQVFTPELNVCGVAGIARAIVLEITNNCKQCGISPEFLMQADEVFLTSSVRGILPVTQIMAHRFAIGTVTRELQRHWRARGWMPMGKVYE